MRAAACGCASPVRSMPLRSAWCWDSSAAGMILGVSARSGLRIMVASKPVDFRKGMEPLAALVMQALACDPFTGDVFIFRSKRSDRLKLLVWDGSGLCLVTKRLETGRSLRGDNQDGLRQQEAGRLYLPLGLTVRRHGGADGDPTLGRCGDVGGRRWSLMRSAEAVRWRRGACRKTSRRML